MISIDWETLGVVEVESIVEDQLMRIGHTSHVQIDEGAIHALDAERKCLVYSSDRDDV